MILNETYYKNLLERFNEVEHLETSFSTNIIALTVKIILKHFQENKLLHINFQNAKETILEIGKKIFIEFSNDIFLNHCDFPILEEGSRLRDKRNYRDGRNHDFIVKKVKNDNYTLEHVKKKYSITPTYDSLIKNFIPIEQRVRKTTLKGYSKFFSDLNKGIKSGFTPTNFEKKIVFIAKKYLWDVLPDRNKIPCIYIPNPRDEDNTLEIKSIRALPDCLTYFTPKYEVCYSNILLKGEKVKTIVVFDTEADKLEQMIADKNRFDFNIIVISNSNLSNLIKHESIPCWNWFKEEFEIVNTL
ncbi:MAG: hypothetical protein M0Q41_12685 [Bacteroidales bacterium]|nr:hypothetical protein [Bacteroidales bacterium]